MWERGTAWTPFLPVSYLLKIRENKVWEMGRKMMRWKLRVERLRESFSLITGSFPDGFAFKEKSYRADYAQRRCKGGAAQCP